VPRQTRGITVRFTDDEPHYLRGRLSDSLTTLSQVIRDLIHSCQRAEGTTT
jgi:hypothetical protein